MDVLGVNIGLASIKGDGRLILSCINILNIWAENYQKSNLS